MHIRTIYDIEADGFESEAQAQNPPLWLLLLKATGVFVVITMIVFFIANYPYIRSQLVDWKRLGRGMSFVKDGDGDQIPDWWEKTYGFNPADPTDASEDSDGDLLANSMEFHFNTNPLDPDTDQDGYFDGEEYRNGYNPNGIGRIDSDKDGIHDWWEEVNGLNKNNENDARLDYDKDKVSNREEYEFGTNPRNADSDGDGRNDRQEIDSGQNPNGRGMLPNKAEKSSKDADLDKLENKYENFFGTDQNNSDTDGDGFDDYHELSRGYDPTGPGMLSAVVEVPSIGTKVPVVWSQSEQEKDILNDLNNGAIHYPGSAFPATRGNVYITGHSSFYSWSKSSYKDVFKDLGEVKIGQQIIVHLSFSSGKKVDVIYKVVSSDIVRNDDIRLFRDYEGHELTLVTCWPVGTNLKRLMVKGELEVPNFIN